MGHTIVSDDALADYINAVGVREHPVLARCRAVTREKVKDLFPMQIGADQGAFMALLVQTLGARKVLEVGTFTGYSTLAMALAGGPDIRITACDVSEEWTSLARTFWDEAGVADRIDLNLAPAVETLDALLADGAAGSYDMAFIDADKVSYDAYYERALQLLRPNGLILVDNTLWMGAVVDDSRTDEDTVAIRAINEKIHGVPQA